MGTASRVTTSINLRNITASSAGNSRYIAQGPGGSRKNADRAGTSRHIAPRHDRAHTITHSTDTAPIPALTAHPYTHPASWISPSAAIAGITLRIASCIASSSPAAS